MVNAGRQPYYIPMLKGRLSVRALMAVERRCPVSRDRCCLQGYCDVQELVSMSTATTTWSKNGLLESRKSRKESQNSRYKSKSVWHSDLTHRKASVRVFGAG